MKRPYVLEILACLTLGLLATLASAAAPPASALEMESRDWRPCELDAGSRAVKSRPIPRPGPHRPAPRQLRRLVPLPQNWKGYSHLAFELRVPAGFPAATDVQVYLKDFHYYWYRPTLPRRAGQSQPLARDQWLSVSLPLTPFNTVWQPGGHQQTWYDAWYMPKEFGVRFFGQSTWSGTVEIRNLRLEGQSESAGSAQSFQPKPNATSVPQYEKFELTWPVTEYYPTLRPAVVDVEATSRP